MKTINFKVLVLAIFDSLFYATVIIAASILLFSCSKSADALVDQPTGVESVVILEVDGKEYTYTGAEVKPSIVGEPAWHNLLCTEDNNNTASVGFRVGGMYADSLYLLQMKDVVVTFKAGSVTYSNTSGTAALHITGKTGNAVTGYFDIPVRNNATGANMRATGRLQNILFNR